MKNRKLAIILSFLLLFNIVFPGLGIQNVYANTISPRVINIVIYEEVRVVGTNKVSNFFVEFNGLLLNNIDTILVNNNGTPTRVLSSADFVQRTNNRILYRSPDAGATVSNILGTGTNITFDLVTGTNVHTGNQAFNIPAMEMIKVETINERGHTSWPVFLNRGSQLQITYSNIMNPLTDGYTLLIGKAGSSSSQVSYTVDTANRRITVADTSNLATGVDQDIIFERSIPNSPVSIRHVVRQSLTITRPLELTNVVISPLRGTRDTIVRIRADQWQQLTEAGTRVYIGGREARRNIGILNPDGTFVYDGNKRGLEVIVPLIENAGPQPIVIVNNHGDMYQHQHTFFYEQAQGPVLRVVEVDPNRGNTNQVINVGIRSENLVAINNITLGTNVNVTAAHKGTTTGTGQVRYFNMAEDQDSFYIKYYLSNGRFAERKVTVNIGRKATIADIDLSILAGTNPSLMQVRTALVQDAGSYDVIVRTETVYYSLDGTNIIEHDSRVEQTAFPSFIFEPDTTNPVIASITPSRGPFDQNIKATITGSNFVVVENEGNRHFPVIIIGKSAIAGNERFKVITRNTEGQTIFYFSTNPNGLPIPDNPDDIRVLEDVEFTVLDANNNIVDGQLRRSGNRIKFTIPAGSINYSGFADVRVYNPTSTGGRGGSHHRENLFEYITPGPNVLPPHIDSVTPDRVAVGRREEVVIRGRNFQPNIMVFVDGEPVQNPRVDIVRGTITFNAPVGRVGRTSVQVINPDGGFASHPFEYILTFSQPQIQRIIPNVGGRGSLIIIKGTGFFPPRQDGETDDIKIGTRVFIDGRDINREYFREGDDPLAPLEPREFVNYFDEEPRQPILGPNGQPLMTFGSNVAVVDNETIYVIVPDPRDPNKPFFMNTPLNVRVVNPDLGSHQINGGFRFIDVVTRPRIDEITPNLGDYRGGNIAEIRGEFFLENARVFFGSQEAQVYRRSNNARSIWVYVPPFGGDMGNANERIVPVTVLNSNGGSFTKYDGYRYVNPGYDVTITRLTPAIGNTAGGDRILITGINFRAKSNEERTALEALPAVYFGGIKVPEENITFVIPPKDIYNEVETSDMIVVERTPSNPPGRVDVTVINFDGATANLRNGFEYRSKQPVITRVLPNQGSLLGGSEITITGRDFVSNGLHVVFGNEVGRTDILSGQATVRLGDVVVHYNAFAEENNITLHYRNLGTPLYGFMGISKHPVSGFRIIEEEEFKIFRIPWDSMDGEEYTHMADENIKIEIRNNDLVVTRRLGVIRRVEGEERITLLTPPAASVGQVQLRVFNHDGRNATSQFTYTNPFRPPVITKVTPVATVQVDNINGVQMPSPQSLDVATASPPGGSPLIIEGSNFRSGVKVFIGDREAEIRQKSPNDDELIVIVPAAAPNTVGRYLRILVVNEDGGSAYGDIVPEGQNRNPYYFRYITEGSFPRITTILPNKGPVTGGTKITIKGTEFKDEDTFGSPREVMVLMGGIPVPQGNVRYVNPQTLEVIVPPGRVGPQTVEVINYDHGRAIANNAFTYISQPTISNVSPGRIFTNDINREVTINGTMFQQGAKVFLGSTLVPINDVKQGERILATGIRGVDANGNNREMAIVGGMEAATTRVEGDNIIKVTFREALDLTNNHLIIINPDGGLSGEYKDFKYEIPIPTRPLVLEGIPGVESSVKLIWSDSAPEVLNRADRYEIFGKKSTDRGYTFIGDTRDHEFLVRNLEVGTTYTFLVRAMNRYGSALEFAEVTVRTFTLREDRELREKLQQLEDEKKKLAKEGFQEIIGEEVIRTIGTEEISVAVPPYLIDFSLAEFKNQTKFTVAIPIEVIKGLNRRITITDGNMSFTLLPRDLYTRQVSDVSINDMADAHVRITIARVTGQEAEGLISAVNRRQRRASEAYQISFHLQVGREISDINSMVRNGQLRINFDALAYPQAQRDRLFLGSYNASSHTFTSVNNGVEADIRNRGIYMLLSNR